eukprot:2773149-Rhodomonas_salina.1
MTLTSDAAAFKRQPTEQRNFLVCDSLSVPMRVAERLSRDHSSSAGTWQAAARSRLRKTTRKGGGSAYSVSVHTRKDSVINLSFLGIMRRRRRKGLGRGRCSGERGTIERDVNPPTNCGVLSLLPLLVSGAKPLQSLLRDRWTYKTASVQKLQHNLYDKLGPSSRILSGYA